MVTRFFLHQALDRRRCDCKFTWGRHFGMSLMICCCFLIKLRSFVGSS
jgi:hypothetical protein